MSERRVGPWVLEAALAEGGTSIVHRARGPAGTAIVKVLKRALADDPAWIARFRRETKALAALRHPNIVPVIDSGTTDDGLPWLAMPELDARTLRAELDLRGKLDDGEAWRVARSIAEALGAAHAIGVVHRDVKPDNVLLVAGEPRLVDFGLAKALEDADKVTATGAPVGTPAYMAPEQWWNANVGPATDQYALGVTLFELLAGRAPFDGEGFAALLQAHVSSEPPTLASIGVTTRPEVEAFVVRLLAKKPEARFANMDEVVRAGDAAFGVARTRAPGPGRAWAWALVGPALMVLVGYAGSHDPRAWLVQAGLGGWPVLVGFVVVAIVLWRRPSLTPLALVPAIQGTTVTYTGWMATVATIASMPIEERLATYHEGILEANVGRFAGALLSVGLLLEARAASRGRTRPHAVGALVLALLAVGYAATGALAWVDARSAAAFLAPTRFERAAEIVRFARVRELLGWAIAVAVVATVAAGVRAVRRAPRATTIASRATIVLAAVWAALAVLDGVLVSRVRATRDALWVELAPELELDAKLAPPELAGLPDPPLAPALKITTTRVSVDADPVGLVTALGTPTGQQVLATDLSHALARAPAGSPLLVAVDRDVLWGSVRPALLVAHELGVREVVFLFSRGPAPSLSKDDPPEAAYVLPKDFGGLSVRIAPDGARLPSERRFADVVADLRAASTIDVR